MFESAYTQKELHDIANNTDHDEFTTDLAVCLKDAYVEIERQRALIESAKPYIERSYSLSDDQDTKALQWLKDVERGGD